MAELGQILGREKIINGIRSALVRYRNGYVSGLKLAGLKLQRESQKLVPVEFGALKASAFARIKGSGFAAQCFVGYTSSYALHVHELVDMKLKGQPRRPNPPHKGRYWDPRDRGQAKFLEEPARRLAPELRNIIMANMRFLR